MHPFTFVCSVLSLAAASSVSAHSSSVGPSRIPRSTSSSPSSIRIPLVNTKRQLLRSARPPPVPFAGAALPSSAAGSDTVGNITAATAGLGKPRHYSTYSDPDSGVASLDKLQIALKSATTKFLTGAERFYFSNNKVGLPGFNPARVLPDLLATLGLSRRQQQSLTEYEDGLLWAGTIQIGTPPKDFLINFDTGSADLWVPGTPVDNGHEEYDPLNSTTAVNTTDSFSISYGDGSTVSGPVYQDTISVASLTATSQHFAAATTVSASFAETPGDGILGLAYASISNIGERPFFDTLVEEGSVKEKVFSFHLADEGSELFLGGTNEDLYQGDITYAPVQSQGYWLVEGNAIVNINSTSNITNKASNFIIDTGTTLIIAPPTEAAIFFKQVPTARKWGTSGYYMYKCDQEWTASFSFAGSDKAFEVSSDYMNLGLTSVGSLWCVAGIAAQDVGFSSWILGDVFLRNVYSIFDLGNHQVGFADLA